MQGKGRLVMAHLILTKFTKEFDSGRNLKSDKTLVSNLILLQAVLDIHHDSLYYWPSPRLGFLSWIFLHLSVLVMMIYEATSCFYSIKERNHLIATAATKATCLNLEFYSYEATISQILVLIVLGTLLLYGIKVVINVLADYK